MLNPYHPAGFWWIANESLPARPICFLSIAKKRSSLSGLPIVGTDLVRHYQDKDIVVRVREDGFEYAGQIHRSLSAAVRAATGTPWNGFTFFGLGSKPGGKHASQ